jgi:predicted nucleic acid-binding protein
VIEAVLDASVILKWFRIEDERHGSAAKDLRARFEAGELRVWAPPLLKLEIMNVAGRRWNWGEEWLARLADDLLGIGLEFREPGLLRAAHWTSRGLTAYDGAYVALAEEESIPLITDDSTILSIAQPIAVPLKA